MNFNDTEMQIASLIRKMIEKRHREARQAREDESGDADSLYDDAEAFHEVLEAIHAGEHRATSGAW